MSFVPVSSSLRLFMSIDASHRSSSSRPTLKSADEDDSESLYDHFAPKETVPLDDSQLTCYMCELEECESDDVATCSPAFACFSTHVREGSGNQYFKKGCTDTHNYGFMCRKLSHVGRNTTAGRYFSDCCFNSFCNNETSHSFLKRVAPQPIDSSLFSTTIAYSLLGITLFLVALVTFFVLICVRRRKKRSSNPNSQNNNYLTNAASFIHPTSALPLYSVRRTDPDVISDAEEAVQFLSGSTSTDRSPIRLSCISKPHDQGISDHGLSSGSGLGFPQLTRVTLARQIEKKEIIGSGRFGTVFRGILRGDAVAIKIFPWDQKESFDRECDLYMKMSSDKNILNFVGSDVKSEHSMEFWLVTKYHPHGSLHHHLKHNRLDVRDALSILLSAAAGIMYLHIPLPGTTSKPGIAHRDLKPTNLLMRLGKDRQFRDEWQVVIADFGLAVTDTQVNPVLNAKATQSSGSAVEPFEISKHNLIVGTSRYMPPEILDHSILSYTDLFSVITKSDIYSFALVMWQTLRRVETGCGDVPDYMMPYADIVSPEPTSDEMRRVVVNENRRPLFPPEWNDNELFVKLKGIISECWREKPEARLTISKVHNKLDDLWKSFIDN